MANVSYLRAPAGERRGRIFGRGRSAHPKLFGRRGYSVGAGLIALVVVLAAGAILLSSAHATLSADSSAIAKVTMPLGGGTIERAIVVTGPHSEPVPIRVSGDRIFARKLVPANQLLTIDVVVKRPGWISWLSGKTEKLHLTITTPVASLRSHFLTVRGHAPLRLQFKSPISVYSYGSTTGRMARHVLTSPQTVVRIPRTGSAGTVFVSAAPRTWESSHAALVSWFPGGGAASAVAQPAPGAKIKPSTPITLTFSKPVSKVLGSHLPDLSPGAATGQWRHVNTHTIVFEPSGYGYGLGAAVHVALPSGVRLVGGAHDATSSVGSWNVPAGSTMRLQQMLAALGYLPLDFKYAGSGPGTSPAAEETAAVSPPPGRFSWRYRNIPAALRSAWSPGSFGTVTRGALMAFENDHGLADDGVPGPIVWRTLIGAMVKGQKSNFGYTFVTVDEGSQSLNLWHSGHTVIASTPVNTGIASAPTALGTFPVYEHLPVTTMSGTNPNGSHYSDPGIPDVSYFNGGDALHGFLRAQYGFPQSLGCVEMPYAVAAKVYPFTPVGTLVHVI